MNFKGQKDSKKVQVLDTYLFVMLLLWCVSMFDSIINECCFLVGWLGCVCNYLKPLSNFWMKIKLIENGDDNYHDYVN